MDGWKSSQLLGRLFGCQITLGLGEHFVPVGYKQSHDSETIFTDSYKTPRRRTRQRIANNHPYTRTVQKQRAESETHPQNLTRILLKDLFHSKEPWWIQVLQRWPKLSFEPLSNSFQIGTSFSYILDYSKDSAGILSEMFCKTLQKKKKDWTAIHKFESKSISINPSCVIFWVVQIVSRFSRS